MIELPLGEFVMGAAPNEFRRLLAYRDGKFRRATPEDPHVKSDEGPQHLVVVDIPIAMGRTEVTFDQWMACVNDGGCNGYIPRNRVPLNGPNQGAAVLDGSHPVIYVSNQDAQSYTEWLNTKVDGEPYRLPTEAEWEYAARAGTTTTFYTGDSLTSDQANFSGRATEMVNITEDLGLLTRGAPVPVETMSAANPWGLRHMAGNVMERTSSCYTKRYEDLKTTRRWLEESARACERLVVRGGGYAFSMDTARSAWRGPRRSSSRNKYDGFRLVKEMS